MGEEIRKADKLILFLPPDAPFPPQNQNNFFAGKTSWADEKNWYGWLLILKVCH